MVKLLTGYTGVNIFAADDQDLYKGIIGTENVVFNVGSCLALTVTGGINSVTATVADGAFSFNGRIVRLSTAETLELTGVESGKYRKCVIAARYAENSSTHIESVTLTPLYSAEDADSAAGISALTVSPTSADFPLYSFVYSSEGLYAESKTTLFTVVPSLQRLVDLIAQEVSVRMNAVADVQTTVTTLSGSLSGSINSNASSISAILTTLGKEARIDALSAGQDSGDYLLIYFQGTVDGVDFSGIVPNVAGTFLKVSVAKLHKGATIGSSDTYLSFDNKTPCGVNGGNSKITFSDGCTNRLCYGIGRKST